MARRGEDQLQAKLRRLAAADPQTEEGKAVVVEALSSSTNHVVGKAAGLVAEHGLDGCWDALLKAFDRFMEQPIKRDPGCVAKLAVVEALIETRYPHPDVFLRGVHHRQMEPAWGGSVDSAPGLRSHSAMGLVAIGWSDAPVAIADLLHDPEVPCRVGAARALAAWGDPVLASALVHLRLGVGEEEPDVVSECFDALLALEAATALPWVVARLFDDDDLYAECAAISLGSSRHDDALGPLQAWVEQRPQPQLRRIGLVAIGLLRSEASIEVLLRWLAEGGEREAEAALEGLGVHAHDPRLAERVRDVAHDAGKGTLLGPTWGGR
ncbi:MAG: hypothetical protein KTR31_16710 [Myxococcales bacterium]|nr:hypothetical protein [Myxococcales bacterium]